MHEGHHHHHHDHEHSHPADKSTAMLTYMLEHNKQHAQELKDLAANLTADGKENAAKTLLEGAEHFDHGNEHLEEALKMIKEA